MYNIGQKIKELRKKNDLTQEKLADYLGVSYQAVSKWETGVNTPDLSLIGPLTNLLHVSADELLGLTAPENDERKAYFEAECFEHWKKDDYNADYEIALQAVAEYPGDFRYLEWLASTEYYTSFDLYSDRSAFLERMESCIRHNLMVYENCSEEELRNSALWLIILAYKYTDRLDEARKYAELYPENRSTTRDDALALCLTGDELLEHHQGMIMDALGKLNCMLRNISDFGDRRDPRVRAAVHAQKAIYEAIIPDGNYLGSSASVRAIHWKLAEIAVSDGNYDTAVQELAKSKQYTLEADRCMTSPKQLYTSLLLDHYGYDYSEGRTTKPLIEYWYEEVPETFAKLADREDFRALLEGQN